MKISFGTDGWRGKIGCDFTLENLKQVIHAFISWLTSSDRANLNLYKNNYSVLRDASAGILIGYDTRFMSEFFAKKAAEEFIQAGIPVWLTDSYVPSPALAYAVKQRKAAGGIIITASHNDPYYNGIKYKPEYGGSATAEIMMSVEQTRRTAKLPPLRLANTPNLEYFSPIDSYIEHLLRHVDMERIANSRFKIISDPIYGSTINLMGKIFNKIGGFVEEIRNEPHPTFGGYTPEPIGRNIAPLVEKVLTTHADIGFSFDGDGDILGIVDSTGSFVQPHSIFAVVLWHLVENRKITGGIATTLATSNLIKSMAENYKIPIYETPVGFKHITQQMLTNDIMIGGEESGGIGVKNNIPDKDAPLIALLVLEAMAYAGKGLDDILHDLSNRFGNYCFHRSDINFDSSEEKKNALISFFKSEPQQFAGLKVKDVISLDGIKYILEDDSWILLRVSGTETKFRIYVEAPNHKQANILLSECEEKVSAYI